jgi:hypothetical protein
LGEQHRNPKTTAAQNTNARAAAKRLRFHRIDRTAVSES